MSNVFLPESFLNFISPYIPENQSLDEFISYCGKPLRKSIRVNTLKISVDAFKEQAEIKGWQLTEIPWCDTGFWLTRPEEEEQNVSLGNTVEYLTGHFYIQEASSMIPPQALFFQQDNIDTILDVCASPGSKTTQLAALMNNQGLLIANEFSSSRLKTLFFNTQRCGVSNTALTHMDGRLFNHLPESFDAILLDAPCSGEGTIRKDPDSMKNWTESSVHEIATTQFELIDAAFQALKPGGHLIYSTCTLNPFENEKVCLQLKSDYPEQVSFANLANLFDGASNCLTADGFLHVWPQIYDSEGFFVAKIHKTGSIKHDNSSPFKRLGQFPFKQADKSSANDFLAFLQDKFAFTGLAIGNIYQRDQELWYFPSQIESFIGQIKFNRIGVKLAEIHKHGYKLDHSLAAAFGQQFTKQVLSVNELDSKEYLMGQDIRPDASHLEKGEILVMYKAVPLGFAKNLGSRIKNQLARELVRDNLR